MKLSKAQLELLSELPTNCVHEYRPAQKLVELGLATWATKYSTYLNLTDAGRTALRAREGGTE